MAATGPTQFKDFPVEPLAGMFDARTPSGKLGFLDFRILLNVDAVEAKARCRLGGWTQYLKDSPYGFLNQDLHDQLLGCQFYYQRFEETYTYPGYQTGTQYFYWVPYAPGYPYGYGYGPETPSYQSPYTVTREYCGSTLYNLYYGQMHCREAITLLFSFKSLSGNRRLIAGAKSRLYVGDDRGGNWRIIADGLGGGCRRDEDCECAAKRFKAAQLGNTVLFTNDVDPVLIWDYNDAPAGCYFWSADYVSELQVLNITQAACVQSWNGFAFVANVVVDGQRIASRLYWSDYNEPHSWTPGGESLAGYHDFGNGERILALEPIGGRLRVYTDRAIYDGTMVSDTDLVFHFDEIYRGPNTIKFPNSLVNLGAMHVYLGESSIWTMAEYDRSPTRLEWMHRAGGVIYEGLPTAWVKDFTTLLAAFGPINKEQCEQAVGGLEWVEGSPTLWFSWPTDDNVCPNMTLRLTPRYGAASLVDYGFTAFRMHRPDFTQVAGQFLVEQGFCATTTFLAEKEGLPLQISDASGAYPYLFNYYESASYPMHASSLAAALCQYCPDDFCLVCDTQDRFVMASASDKTLKQFTPKTYAREEYLGNVDTAWCPDTAIGEYEDRGYTTLFQGDAYDYGTNVRKLVNGLAVDFSAEAQTTPNQIHCAVGYGSQPDCQTWMESNALPLACQDVLDTDQRGDAIPFFPFYNEGQRLAWRVWVTGTGGGFCANSITLSIKRSQGEWTI